jgi:hypothetical protein
MRNDDQRRPFPFTVSELTAALRRVMPLDEAESAAREICSDSAGGSQDRGWALTDATLNLLASVSDTLARKVQRVRRGDE